MPVQSKFADTDRLRVHYIDGCDPVGVPVLMIHGNLTTGRFDEHIMETAPPGFRFISPDMRGFGGTESTTGRRHEGTETLGSRRLLVGRTLGDRPARAPQRW